MIKTAMILAAGYGKRLLPITSKLPKPMIKIHEKPLIGHAIDSLLSIGINRIVINTHYKNKMINEYIESHYNSLEVTTLYEPTLLDTAGGVKNAIKFFNQKMILVLNSDIFWNSDTKEDLRHLINSVFNRNIKCLLLLSNMKNIYGLKNLYGDFLIKNNLIQRNKTKKNGLIYTGAQIIDKSVIESFNKTIFSFNEVWDFLIEKRQIDFISTKSKILHIGNAESMKYFNKFKP